MFSDESTTSYPRSPWLESRLPLSSNHNTTSYPRYFALTRMSQLKSTAVALVSRLNLQNSAVYAADWCQTPRQRQLSTI